VSSKESDLERENRSLRAALWAVIDLFEGAVANFESRGKGGQHVPYHGDFASMPPSAAHQMQRWSRDLRCALKGEWPMTREEWMARWPNTDPAEIDYMYRNREP